MNQICRKSVSALSMHLSEDEAALKAKRQQQHDKVESGVDRNKGGNRKSPKVAVKRESVKGNEERGSKLLLPEKSDCDDEKDDSDRRTSSSSQESVVVSDVAHRSSTAGMSCEVGFG